MNNRNILLIAQSFAEHKVNQQEEWEKKSVSSDGSLLTEDYDLNSSYSSYKTIEEFKAIPLVPMLMIDKINDIMKNHDHANKTVLSLHESIKTEHIYDNIDDIEYEDNVELFSDHYSTKQKATNNNNENNILQILHNIYNPLLNLIHLEDNNCIIESYSSLKLLIVDIANKWKQYAFPSKWNTIPNYHLLYDYELMIFSILFVLLESNNIRIMPTILNHIENFLSLIYENYNMIIALVKKKSHNNFMSEEIAKRKQLVLHIESIKSYLELLIRVILEEYTSYDKDNQLSVKLIEIIEFVTKFLQTNDLSSGQELKTYITCVLKQNKIDNTYRSILPELYKADNREQRKDNLIVNIDNLFMSLENKKQEEGINIVIRPYSYSFFKELSNYYEITIVSSEEENILSDFIDQINIDHYIKYRIFKEKGKAYSDISLYGKDMTKIIIINTKESNDSFQNQTNNIVTVSSFDINANDDNTLKTLTNNLLLIHKTLMGNNDIIKSLDLIKENNGNLSI